MFAFKTIFSNPKIIQNFHIFQWNHLCWHIVSNKPHFDVFQFISFYRWGDLSSCHHWTVISSIQFASKCILMKQHHQISQSQWNKLSNHSINHEFLVFPTFHWTNSINIFTEEDYHHFTNSPLPADTKAITIFPSSGCIYPQCDILQYAHKADTTFRDSSGNIIRTTLAKRKVETVYSTGQALLGLLPRNFSSYAININCGAFVKPRDVEIIPQWNVADSIEVADNSNVALALLQRIDEFTNRDVYLSVGSHWVEWKGEV